MEFRHELTCFTCPLLLHQLFARLNALSTFLTRLTRLKVDSQKRDGEKIESPYKPALLLAVIEGIEGDTGQPITDNRIYITPELIASFKTYCELLSPGPPQ